MRIYISLLVLTAFVLGAVLFVFNGEPSTVKEGEVQAYELTNGMKLRVIENHRAPVVVSQVWYNVGSSFEHDGITGVSHVLEHMM
ncbi:MAG: insulinase family protein, partial [Gammaproteobacteria bacterium]|nr:insulinase family protein [Gammaproteobacteria bacterium]